MIRKYDLRGRITSYQYVEGADAYQWYLDGEAISGANSFEIETDEPGSYYVLASNDGCSATSEEVALNVAALPNVEILEATPFEICTGDELELNATSGFETYSWFLNEVAIEGEGASILVTEAGTYHVEVYDGICTNSSEQVTVTVHSLPDAFIEADAQSICADGSALLSGPSGVESYQWWFNGQVIDGAIEANYIATQEGTYVLSTINAAGCSNSSEPLSLTVVPLPDAFFESDVEAICPGEAAILTGPQGITGYQWWYNGEAIDGANSSIYEASQPGVYQLITTGKTGCNNSSEPFSLEVYETAIPTIATEENILTSSTADSYQWYFNGMPIPELIVHPLKQRKAALTQSKQQMKMDV